MDENTDQSKDLTFFVTIDLDDAGQHVGESILNDDIEGLMTQSHLINSAQNQIMDWAEENGGTILSSGGDETFVGFPQEMPKEDIISMGEQISQMVGTTATIGTGESPSQAGKALLYGKLNGKAQLVQYSPDMEDELMSAHAETFEDEVPSDTMPQQSDDEDYDDEDYDDEDDDFEYEDEDEQNPSEDPSEDDYFEGSGLDEETEDAAPLYADNSNDETDEAADLVNEAGKEEGSEQDDMRADKADEDMVEAPGQEQPEMDAAPQENESAPAQEDLKQKLAEMLEAYKNDQSSLEALAQENPELYSQVIVLLQQMIEVAKLMNAGQQEGPQELPPEEQQTDVSGASMGKPQPQV